MSSIILFRTFFLYVTLLFVSSKVPVIIDTDLGPDNDDAFAILYVLGLPNIFDVKLISTCQQNTTKKAQTIAKLLTDSGRDEIPIVVGLETFYNNETETGAGLLEDWGKTFPLSTYKGGVKFGIENIVSLINKFTKEDPISILAIGPMTNIAGILNLDDSIRRKIKLFTMGGSIYTGVHGLEKIAEYNIVMNITAAQRTIKQHYEVQSLVLVPLDTSSYIQILNSNYKKLLFHITIAGVGTLLSLYGSWFLKGGSKYQKFANIPFNPINSTSPMFDVQAAISMKHFTLNSNYTDMPYFIYEKLSLIIGENGICNIDATGSEVISTTHFKEEDKDKAVQIIGEEIVETILNLCK